MAMKKKGAARGGLRKMKAGSRISNAAKTEAEKKRAAATKRAAERAKTDKVKAGVKQAGNTKQESADRAKTLANTRKDYAAMDASRNTTAAQRAAGTGHRVHGIKNPEYKDVSTQDYADRPSLLKDKATTMRPKSRQKEEKPTPSSPNKRTGTANKVPKSGTSPKTLPKPNRDFGGKGLTKSLRPKLRPEEKKNGGAVTKKMGGGTMKKKGMAKGGKLAKMNPGGKLEMVKNKAGKMVPAFAADGKGKMAKGGAVAKKMGGGKMTKKGMAKGGAVAKKMGGGKMMKKGYAKGGAVTKKMGGGKMTKKGMAKGGAVTKKMGGGRMATKGSAKGGTFARGSGAARPQRFRKNG